MEDKGNFSKPKSVYENLFDAPSQEDDGRWTGSFTLIKKLQVLLDFFDYAPGGFLVLDRSGVVLSCNQHLADLLKAPRAEIIGNPLYPFVIHSHRDQLYLHLRRVFVRQLPAVNELMLENRQGEFFWMHLRSFGDNGYSGQWECRSIMTDITELKGTQDRLTERTQEVERLNKRLRALAMEMSRVEQQERRRLAEILHDHLQQILVSAMMQLSHGSKSDGSESLHPLIDRVIGYLKEAVEISRSLSVDLCPPVLNEAGLAPGLEWLAHQMEKRNGFRVTVKTHSPVEPIPEEIRILIYQSVRELLMNVVKHSGADAAAVNLYRHGADHVRITVTDQGSGFDPEILETSNRATGERDSFGLFSIQERMKHLGGTLNIESRNGSGCRTTLTIPLEEGHLPEEDGSGDPVAQEPFLPSQESAPETLRETIRILIVDDHKVLREGLVSMIEMADGLEPIGQAADGQAAMDQADALKPDVILMDVNMPKISGIQATKTILERHPEIKVIGLSMHIEEGVAAAMKEAGAVDYLTKDGSVETIIETIRQVVRPD